MSNNDSGRGTLRKSGNNVRQTTDKNYNTDKDSVIKGDDYGTIDPDIRKKFPLSKRRSK